jgi:hypothetical protein
VFNIWYLNVLCDFSEVVAWIVAVAVAVAAAAAAAAAV